MWHSHKELVGCNTSINLAKVSSFRFHFSFSIVSWLFRQSCGGTVGQIWISTRKFLYHIWTVLVQCHCKNLFSLISGQLPHRTEWCPEWENNSIVGVALMEMIFEREEDLFRDSFRTEPAHQLVWFLPSCWELLLGGSLVSWPAEHILGDGLGLVHLRIILIYIFANLINTITKLINTITKVIA